MHEIRVTVPEGRGKDVASLARNVGIKQVSVYPVFAYGPNERKEVISAETSTPKARHFADAVLTASWFDSAECTLTSRELRAIVTEDRAREITRPMVEPPINVFEDLWQLNNITVSYFARAFAGAILLAYGMLQDNPITIVVAALFLPFLSQVLAISFGAWSGDWSLAGQGLKALTVSTIASIFAGAIVTYLHGGPMLFQHFSSLLPSFAISAVIGLAAGPITADDAGRRYFIGVAAAVQYGIFPVWFGYCLIRGFPPSGVTAVRIGTFGINVATIAMGGLLGYLLLRIKRKDVEVFVKHRRNRHA
ncbi:MAG: hypothetical protein JOY62_15735 [Acidobacteriaceae bacterium]|nr:hypothetical protein [Acidobacteriaceae bacterium]MBV9781416.1 hypothetical protein [Acidobacteriaceae bacterium]